MPMLLQEVLTLIHRTPTPADQDPTDLKVEEEGLPAHSIGLRAHLVPADLTLHSERPSTAMEDLSMEVDTAHLVLHDTDPAAIEVVTTVAAAPTPLRAAAPAPVRHLLTPNDQQEDQVKISTSVHHHIHRTLLIHLTHHIPIHRILIHHIPTPITTAGDEDVAAGPEAPHPLHST